MRSGPLRLLVECKSKKSKEKTKISPVVFRHWAFFFCGGALVEALSRRPKLLNQILSERGNRSVIAVLSISRHGECDETN
jgi:hypothetical protein